VSDLVARSLPGENGKDADYVFLTFVTRELPSGVVGLLIAVILCAAMSASASALNALGSSSVVDFYRVWRPAQSDGHYLAAAKLFTVGWGAVAVSFAGFAALLDNLIQAVNILGSIFYGPMLGVFLVGFFMKRVGANAAFFATLAAQALVVATFALTRVAYLWYNVIGCGALVAIALLLQPLMTKRAPAPP
jgi:Na+/proline symporter